MKKAVIFDLDGTLSDSIVSIAHCANRALADFGFAPYETKRYQYFVGDGAAELIRRCLINRGDEKLTYYDRVKASYDAYFAVDCMYQVKPYPGILELLSALQEKGIKMAVLSNKPHNATVKVIQDLFGDGIFDIVQGQTPEIQKKPSPDGVFLLSRKLGIDVSEMLYLGDTNTDMQTGKAAGAFTIGVLWGFRERKELEENHADAIIEKPMETLEYITKG